ncbi:carbonic anhydrase/acetyltransferase-like protein (isoleucine patch superfamily) [Caldicellulosiruptor bescii]|jgi:carbonic anhydrase/acetyltransferase-like protein (isoleucine patch superfamily)|uniref:Carbonic anhydrase n=2 Tax=Caldicellulosiruptor bescii TaxID=31899 RepID=B9MPI7_CALBD|nr:gamma carbonic anhydrase family protein [Caldicellulosiruptor bescii]ACM59748.1 carbonic anhydrase [Caldicellulosiruptor bescii DSM 6725]PBC87157.1 carbonic anhydrase/acetyltransferase-like protein (isoleucine patch superfamily) [Caldicellulosiruptor bescii]PBC90096.1 carbonic anhydrase/acetyltransferase-like protein (isoleucine patch superfamily) [Caldicellulosiruptor bescii]PBD04473.1 carbonic anhydrase/acetyltransferase-like protein (isoleucine patch superfamily) [Caldicellulosiruptor bes
MIISYKGKTPKIAPSAFVAENAVIIGDVEIGENSSVWFGCVLRCEENRIIIGKNTNIQDLTTIHTDHCCSVIIGDNVTVGHNVVLHGCEIGNNVLIGMGTIIMNGSKIGDNSLIGAGSLITQNMVIPPNTLVFGRPAKVIRELTPEEIEKIAISAKEYIELSNEYKKIKDY